MAWHKSPCVPGHEIIGKVMAVGKRSALKPGQIVGVGAVDDAAAPVSHAGGLEYCDGRSAYRHL
jgi:uncharacterized zinc-type alcohol dehydrogenase-like protein